MRLMIVRDEKNGNQMVAVDDQEVEGALLITEQTDTNREPRSTVTVTFDARHVDHKDADV